MTTTDDYQWRIADVYFDSPDEAEAWVEAGNIGGTYSIIRQVYCAVHHDFVDEAYDREMDEYVCEACFALRAAKRVEQRAERQQDREKLADWLAGRPIR